MGISPQLRMPEKLTRARLKGLIIGFYLGSFSSCRRTPFREFYFFSCFTAQRSVVTTAYQVNGFAS